LFALVGQADKLEQLGDASLDLGTRALGVLEAEGDIPGDRQVGEQRVGLEDDAVIALRRRQGRDVAPALLDRAAGLQVEAGDGTQKRGLAAARRAEEADELSLADVERYVASAHGIRRRLSRRLRFCR
jgi:hypothetical protein